MSYRPILAMQVFILPIPFGHMRVAQSAKEDVRHASAWSGGLQRFSNASHVVLMGILQTAILYLFSCIAAYAATPGLQGEATGETIPSPFPAEDILPLTPEDAAAQISGSQWPGVINHLLQRPLPDAPAESQAAVIHIEYPSFGFAQVDADIRSWVTGIANAFASHLDLNSQLLADENGDNAAKIGLNDGLTSKSRPAFELWGSYSISRPSDAAVSITFEIWNYVGTDQGNLDILTLNYSLITGQRLAFMDLFEKPETALELMSHWSREKLLPRLGASLRIRMLNDGTAPLVENFSSLTLTPDGICINFQPYQVAPGAAGIQKVEMPLAELLPSSPLLALWGR